MIFEVNQGMNETSLWQRLSRVGRRIGRVWREFAGACRHNTSMWRRYTRKILPYVLVAILASALTVTAFGIQNINVKSLAAEKDALEESKQSLEQALTDTEDLLNQMLILNRDLQTLLEEAKREEVVVTDKIDELKDTYENAEQSALQHWVVPMKYTMCTSGFGYRYHPVEGEGKFHSGVDLAAPAGTPIVASRGGRVIAATYDDSAGNYVDIDHGDGFVTRYMHMSRSIVSTGQVLLTGQVIGYCGDTGKVTGVHLHFGVYYNGEAVDPAKYMDI